MFRNWAAPEALIVAIAAVAFSGTALATTADAKTGGEISAQCAACHGSNGVSVENSIPNLAGQHYQYLVEQMLAYKQGTRNNPIMNEMIKSLTDEQIDDIAAYYSSESVSVGSSSKHR